MDAKEYQELLRGILDASPGERLARVKAFQNAVWGIEDGTVIHTWQEIIIQAAHDLDYYEPQQQKRREDAAFFGEDKLASITQEVLRKLEAGQ